MKYLFTISFLFCFTFSSYSQENNKVQEAETIYFYGYDFTQFKLVEAEGRHFKLMSEPLQQYIYGWIGYISSEFTRVKFQIALKKYIVYDFDESTRRNEKIKEREILSLYLPESKEESYYVKTISNYKLPQNKGIGLIAFMEYAEKKTESTAIRFIFFDIKSRKIMNTYSSVAYAGAGTGMIRHWGKSFVKNIYDFSRGLYYTNSTSRPCGKEPKAPPKFNDPQYKINRAYKDYKRAHAKWRDCMGYNKR
jgi:hypothetical protein